MEDCCWSSFALGLHSPSMTCLGRLRGGAAQGEDGSLTLCLPVLLQSKAEAQAYHKLLVSRLKEQRERRSESLAKKRAIRQASQVG